MMLRHAPRLAALLAIFGAIGMTAGAAAAEGRLLRVGPRGEEYRTIQEAVKAAGPGDTVLVSGGVYREGVAFPRPGEPGRPITVVAVRNQVVVVSPGRPLEGRPEPVEGHPNVFRWVMDAEARDAFAARIQSVGIWEASSHLRLVRTPSLAACEGRLASWHYDAAAKDLYVRSGGAAAARDLPYVVEDAARPCFDVSQPHIVLDGLQMAFGAHGALVHKKAAHVTIRNCRAYCNRSAGFHVTGDDHVVEGNEVFRNNQYGIQLRHGVNRVRVAGNTCRLNGPNNGETTDTSVPTDLGIYSKGEYVVFEGNIVIGLHQCAFRNKFGGNNTNVFRRNVVRGFFDCAASCVENNTILVNGLGSRHGFFPERVNPRPPGDAEAVDPSGEWRRMNVFHPVFDKEAPCFADPAYLDFRLQAASPYLGRGAFPERGALLYVDPANGDDAHDGRSEARALKTLGRAMERAHPGYTVYLAPGEYEESLRIMVSGLGEREPFRIRAGGRSPRVVLKGGIVAEKARHVAIEGVTVLGATRLSGCSDVAMSHCVIAGGPAALDVSGCEDVRLDHLTVAGDETGLRVEKSRGVALINSLFARAKTAVVCDAASAGGLYEDWNVYGTPAWRVGEADLRGLDEWRKAIGSGAQSRVASVDLQDGFALPLGSALSYAAADVTHIGARPAPPAERLEIRDLRAAAVTPMSASLTWRTPRGPTESRVAAQPADGGETVTVEPITTFQVMGEFFDQTMRTSAFFTADRHATLSGLKPGKTYDVTVTVMDPERGFANSANLRLTAPEAARQGRVLHVSPEGNDEADGLGPERAWKTLRKAASEAGPGDRVVVHPGVYRETLRPRVSGTREQPVVFESREPGAAVIDLMQNLTAGIEAVNVDYVHVRGFRIINGVFSMGHNALVANGRGVRISSCQATYPPKSSFAKLALGHGGLVASDAPDLIVDNNVFVCGYVGVGVSNSPGARIIGNVIVGEGNYGVVIIPGDPEDAYVIANNIFYRAIMGYKTGPNIWVMNLKAKVRSDHNLFWFPPGFKSTIGKLPDTDRVVTLAEWQRATGLDAHSVMDRPEFVDPERGDFRLAPGSVGLRLADDGGVVGIRPGYGR
jgi:hypothetical protein